MLLAAEVTTNRNLWKLTFQRTNKLAEMEIFKWPNIKG